MKSNYANRGSHLEQLIQYANTQYQNKGIARIDKISTPIDPERVLPNGKIYGHYAQKSTVDYIGTIKPGKFICFDCKETSDKKRLPLKNIHRHQIEYMLDVYKFGGTAFLIVYFSQHNKYYRLAFQDLYEYWKNYDKSAGRVKRAAGTASIPYEAFKDEVVSEKGFYLHYLKGIVD